MKKPVTINQVTSFKVVPVVALDHLEDALPLAQALIDGGLPLMEITFRTAVAEAAIALISKSFPEMLIGAGTILTLDQVKKAISAGAKFIVTPGFDSNIVNYCKENNILIIPGAVTPTELTYALNHGIDVVKFFPAEDFGGIRTIRSLSAPFSNIKFIPTGGINEKNVNDYLSFEKVLACGGTWMCPKTLISEKKFSEITQITKQSLKNIRNKEGILE